MLTSRVKHGIHCCVFTFLICFFVCQESPFSDTYVIPLEAYGYMLTILLYTIHLMPLLITPIIAETALGLFLFNAFEEVKLRCSPERMPFICFRIITRGDFPGMVKRNVQRNMTICTEAGLQHFVVEVVTEKPIGVPTTSLTREVVVPVTYRPKSGTIFKGRVCQYMLEEGNYSLQVHDWVVQMDEETLVTIGAVHGILNFISAGKHQIGQGVISFANQGVINWMTTLMDCVRVADDLGRLRWELNVYKKPLSGWKGCFIVVQAGVERKVTYDHGYEHSLSEEHCFRITAIAQGYSFGFVQGEMWEKSPFTIWELLHQRRRWLQGRFSVVNSSYFAFRAKWFTLLIAYALVCLPLNLVAIPLRLMFPLPGMWLADAVSRFLFATVLYMYLFGVVKSFDIRKIGLSKFLLYLLGVGIAFPFDITLQFPVVILMFSSRLDSYFIVQKDECRMQKGQEQECQFLKYE